MQIKINENQKGEFIFSWKEIWILIKKRKLTFDEQFLDYLVSTLMSIKFELVNKRKQKQDVK
jgi:hypothetical protein